MASTILYADDNADDVALLKHALKQAAPEMQIHTVEDGEAVVSYLRGEGEFADRAMHPLPVLLLMDLKMNRMDGFEVLKWLRQQPGLRRLAVIVLTSSNRPEDVNRAYDLGANSYAIKPVGHQNLVAFLAAVVHYWQYHTCPDCQRRRMVLHYA